MVSTDVISTCFTESPVITPKKYYKCFECKVITEESICPICGRELKEMCQNDTIEPCTHGVMYNIAYCDICGEPICPICGSHDVVQISRVTGYLQDVKNWNSAKKQELKDRKKYSFTV